MKNKIGRFIIDNFIFVALALIVLMTVIPLPPVVLEVMIEIETIFSIAILIYSFSKHRDRGGNFGEIRSVFGENCRKVTQFLRCKYELEQG